MKNERNPRARASDLGPSSRPRRATRLLVALTSILAQPLHAFGMDLEKTVNFDIPAQELGAALLQFSRQTRIQVIVSGDIRGERTRGVSGRLAIKQALSELLQPAGLQCEVASDDSITVTRATDLSSQTSRAGSDNALIRLAQVDTAA